MYQPAPEGATRRVSKGAAARAARKPGHYKFSDTATQRKLLQGQIHRINAEVSARLGAPFEKINDHLATLAMMRRVGKFYGLRNKYPAAKKEHNR